jgi:hypothetical protein
MKLKDLLKEGSDSKTNYFYLNDNYEETLHKIPLDLQFEIQDLLDEKLGNGFFEKTIKKYEDEFSKLAFYHPIHDKWLPKEQAAKVENELDKFVSIIEKELNKKIAKLISDLKKGADDVKKDIKISLQPAK